MPRVERIAQSDPNAARRPWCAKLSGHRINAVGRPEAAAGSGKRIGTQHGDRLIAAIEEIAAKLTPDLVIISAGFDAHKGDPLGQLLLSDDDFVQMTRVVKQWAEQTCGGRIVSCMEGGYNLETLGETVRSHVRELQS